MLSTRRRYYITPILKLQVFFVILLFLLNRKTECELINVSFSAHHFYAACQYLGKEMEQQFLSPLYPPKINIRPFADCTLGTDHSFLNFHVGNNAELYIRLRMLLVETLVTCIRYAQFKQGTHYNEWLHRILEQMTAQENLEEGVSALLRLSGFSHGHLCRIMKQQVGMSPNQYITKLRMVYAANLLRNSDNDILTISLKSGYTSMSHFVATFKKYYGLSPSRFRQQHSNMADWK